MAVSMMFGLGTTAFATEEAGMVFGDENESLATTTGNELLDFDSVEEAEAYLKQLMVEQSLL